ncbi:MAG: LysR substrate-binding domain-containing protein [Burkholderiaceae bacterium]
MKNVTVRQMRVFSEAARQLNFARAAEALHITAPAVTMQIKEFEAQIELPLFERRGRQVQLTMVGEYMLSYVRRVLSVLKDAEDTLARFKGLTGGQLAIGMVSTAEYFVPRLLAQFRAEHPAVDLRLRLANREQLVELLQRNEVDLAVMGRPPREMATRAEPFAMHPHVLIAPPGHRFTRREQVGPRALADEPCIVRESGSGTRAALEEFAREHRVELRIAMEMTTNESIKQAVMAGMGVALISLHTIGLELRQGLLAVVEVEGLPVMRRWHVVNRLSKALSPAAEAFRYFVLERGEATLAEMFGPAPAGGPPG